MDSIDVMVVGAGPVGLTMAAELARHGLSCRVIDKAVAPSTTSKALAVFPRTLEVFEQMGVVEPALQAGHRLHSLRRFPEKIIPLYSAIHNDPASKRHNEVEITK